MFNVFKSQNKKRGERRETLSVRSRAGKAQVSTRIRLATSQTVVAVAKLADGSCWSDSVELLVTLAACLE